MTRSVRSFAACLLLAVTSASASPLVPAGDTALRHDLQLLADYGVIKGPTSTWPLAWGPIISDIRAFDSAHEAPRFVVDALARVQERASWEMRTDTVYFDAHAALAEKPQRIRSFENTPRGRSEFGLGMNLTGDILALSLRVQGVDSSFDDEEVRADGSMLGVALGNTSITVNTLDRWWGPGWDGSLILSNNARPFPTISVDRIYPERFRSKLLAWLGPWDFSLHFGQLESERAVPDAQFFALRFNFKPLPSLEVGVSRTAQWCGDGRPCNADTFVDLLLGRDNIGDGGVTASNEPGNQMAGFDVRWATRVFDRPLALYGQFIGEDEAGGLPSRYLGQLGVEGTGMWRDRWSYRWFAEFAGTSCQFNESSELFNCAYNNAIYQTGYRYRGRSIGHGVDNDARVISVGLVAIDAEQSEWNAVLRFGGLNRGGSPDPANSLTPTREDIVAIDVRHARVFSFGELSLGLGYESIDDEVEGATTDDFRAFLQWRSSY